MADLAGWYAPHAAYPAATKGLLWIVVKEMNHGI